MILIKNMEQIMNNIIKLVLVLGVSLFLSACGGGDTSSNENKVSYTDFDDFNDYADYNGNDYDGGKSIALANLAGYGVPNANNRYIAFCNDNNRYFYKNINGDEENGTYTVTDNMINLTNSNGEEFTIETDNGSLEEGKSYILADDTNFTVSKIIQAGC